MRKTVRKQTEAASVVVNEDFSYFAKDGRRIPLSLKEKIFCDEYLASGGQRGESILKAGYHCKSLAHASKHSWELLKKPNIMAYINAHLKDHGFNNDSVFEQHLFILNQHADLGAKAKAVEMYYKLKGMNAPDKAVSVNVEVESDSIIDKVTNELNEIYKKAGSLGDGGETYALDTQAQDKE